jgi:hypothetical protein
VLDDPGLLPQGDPKLFEKFIQTKYSLNGGSEWRAVPLPEHFRCAPRVGCEGV